ncbi:MAG TPA: hypothetical protein DEQ47_12630 [Solibacterales bacterium]|nr:hypothetical protein [Bryobacterales bacterium]
MIEMRCLFWTIAWVAIFAGGYCEAEPICPLLRNTPPFSAHGETRLTALLGFGLENHISFGIESFSDDLLQPLTTNLAKGTAESKIRQILGMPAAYRVSCATGVVIVQDSRVASPPWLNRRVPRFHTPKTTLFMANAGLWMLVETLLNPRQQGFAGDSPPGDAEDQVGPYDIRGATVRGLLCQLAGSSKGTAWLIERPGLSLRGTASRNRLWTLWMGGGGRH